MRARARACVCVSFVVYRNYEHGNSPVIKAKRRYRGGSRTIDHLQTEGRSMTSGVQCHKESCRQLSLRDDELLHH